MLGIEDIDGIAIEEDLLGFVERHAMIYQIVFGLFLIPTEFHPRNIYKYIPPGQ